MDEYIEREALLREIERREALMVGDKLVSVDAMKSFIKNRPAADVAPVRHGQWEDRDDGFGGTYYHCSVCGEDWCTIDGTPAENGMRYCPQCGARMDGDADG